MSEQLQIAGVAASKTAEMATGTVTLDCASSNFFTGTFPAANVALVVKNLKPGQDAHFKVTQDAVGGRVFTFPLVVFPNQIIQAPTAANLQPAAGANAITTFELTGSAADMTTVDVTGRIV
jgi:hypothetical protein